MPLGTPRSPILYSQYSQSRPSIFPELLFQLKLILHDIPYLFCINFLNRPDPILPFWINRIFDLHGTVSFHRFPILLSDHCMGGKLILILVIQVTQYKKLFSMETGIPLFLDILKCSQPGQVSVIIRSVSYFGFIFRGNNSTTIQLNAIFPEPLL